MAERKDSIIPVFQQKKRPAMRPLQHQFNQRVLTIQQLKKEMQVLEKAIPWIRSMVIEELKPLLDKVVERRVNMVTQLDRSYDFKFFRHKEKAKINEIILHQAYDLIGHHERHDLKGVFDKRAGMPFDQYKRPDEEIFYDEGRHLYQHLYAPEDTVVAHIQKKRKQTDSSQPDTVGRSKQSKEPARISKTSRTVYTRLVKEFHPDKEPDEERKLWKTEVMKRVTQAYKSDDFFALLTLEVELMQGGEQQTDTLPDDQIIHYIKVLDEQIEDLRFQLLALQSPPAPFHQMSHIFSHPRQAATLIMKERQLLKEELAEWERDLQHFSDKKNIRIFLREYSLKENGE